MDNISKCAIRHKNEPKLIKWMNIALIVLISRGLKAKEHNRTQS